MKIFAIALLWIFFVVSWIWCDTIYYYIGRPKTNVTITSDTYQQVIFRTETSDAVQMDTSVVQKLEYDDTPAVFFDAQNAQARCEYSKAIQWYNSALEVAKNPPVVRDWIQHYVPFYQAKTYQAWAMSSQDSTYFQSALQAYDKALNCKNVTRFYLECYFGKAQIYLQLQEFDQAQQNLDQITKLASDLKADIKDRWQYRLTLFSGDLLLEKKDYSAAVQQYQEAKKIATTQKRNTDIQSAVLAIGNTYIQQSDWKQAETYFTKLPQEYPNMKEVEAGSKSSLALCYFNQQKYLQARQLALEVLLRLPQYNEQQPMCLFILGRCYQKLSEQETGAAETAQIYYNWLKKNYPDSKWTKQIDAP